MTEELEKNIIGIIKYHFGESKATRVLGILNAVNDSKEKTKLLLAIYQDIITFKSKGYLNLRATNELIFYKFKPVGILQFIQDKYYLGLGQQIYPEVLVELEEMNNGNYTEIVHTGGIGSAKTTTAVLTQLYQLYLLSAMKDPHKAFGLDDSSEILIVFQSITAILAKKLGYERFKTLVKRSPYFNREFPFNKDIESELQFPHRIIVRPISGEETAAIGHNVIGGTIDELNYMESVKDSKRATDGKDYDQAIRVYNSIARRRKTRFYSKGFMPGILSLVSSKRYEGQFTDIKEAEAKDDPTIYVYDKRVWEVKPWEFERGKWFRVFIGDESRKPRVLEQGEKLRLEDEGKIMRIPWDFRVDFLRDLSDSLREIAGVSNSSVNTFIPNYEAINKCFTRSWQIVSSFECDFIDRQLEVYPNRIVKPDIPRFIHVDLGLTSDSAGFCMGHVSKIDLVRFETKGEILEEYLPYIDIDILLEVCPPKSGEILFYKIRALIHKLKELGINIKWITFDTYQSADSIQLLRQAGFSVGIQSIDKTTIPYDYLKEAIYDERLSGPDCPKVKKELKKLIRNLKKNKIDHLPKESKDLSDSLAGVVIGLILRRENWLLYDVPLLNIPVRFRQNQDKIDEKEEKELEFSRKVSVQK